MHYRKLGRTGLNVSILGFGGSSLGGAFRQTDDAEAISTVRTALDLGINFLDVAPYYGATKAETVLGRALQGVPRESYLLATKVGQYGTGEFDFSTARIEHEFNESCRRLGTDYVDLLQCHDIEFADLEQIAHETIPTLLRLKAAGRIGHIGITGLPLRVFPALIERVGAGVIETILSFCHYELNDDSLGSLVPYLAGKGVGIINASPTGMGLLTPRGVPSWHPASPAIVAGAGKAVAFCAERGADIIKLAIQFSTNHPGIATTLVGTASPANIALNVAHALAPIDYELMAEVLAVLRPIHNHNFTRGLPESRDPILH